MLKIVADLESQAAIRKFPGVLEFTVRVETRGHVAFPELFCHCLETAAEVHANEWPKLFIMAVANPWTTMTSDSTHSVIVARKSIWGMIRTVFISASFVLVLLPSLPPTTSGADGRYSELVDQVDGERILTTVTDLQNFGSRAFNASSMWNSSVYIHDRFAELGLWATYQDFQVNGYPQRNVVAIMNGTDPEAPQYLFGAHYDSITLAIQGYEEGNTTNAPGADDDASGVAATIELATVLHDKEFNSTVKFVAFGAEETGLNGSSAFVQKEIADGVLYAGTAIMDMIGFKDSQQNEISIFREDPLNLMAEHLQKVVSDYGLDLSLTIISGTSFGYSDHYPFWLAGYPSILVIEEISGGLPVNPYYHSENDTADHLSQEQMTVVTKTLLGCFLELQSPNATEDHSAAVLVVTAAAAFAIVVVISLIIIRRRKAVV